MSREDPIFSLLYKLIILVIMVIGLVYIIPPALGVFGIFSCTGCDPLTEVIALGFLPVAAIFIILYFMWKRFASD